MKKLIVALIVFTLAVGSILAVSFDDDGQLGLTWTPPDTTGKNPLAGHLVQYDINGVVDSIEVFVPVGIYKDSSVVLLTVGDYASAKVRAISTAADTSDFAYSDSVTFDYGTGIDPPTAVGWE